MATLIVPEIVPSPIQDSETLKQAFQGWGTDEKAVIRVLGQRNAGQRKKITQAYQQLYNESLFDSLQSELSGDFLNAILLWTYDPPERDARLINDALKARKKGVKHLQVIVEVACASPHHLMAVRQAYCSLFECSVEEDIASNIQLPLRKFLVALVSSYRYDKEVVDMNVAKLEAAHLHESIKKKELDHNHVVWILGTRNFFQLRATFACYKQEYSSTIDQDILKCGNDDLQALLRITILCIESPEKHFAEVLHSSAECVGCNCFSLFSLDCSTLCNMCKVINSSVVGLGTDEDSLTRAIVTRAEVDMVKINEEYSRAYKESVADAVIGDTSGDYKNFLLTLLGKKI
ncbi:annexin D3-like isoform X1 [Chenopodium quinoa]|uniref:annexin D3-like isoform X1 n=1 Tax=Chenopodium quinoa TaxID=63459 RepID=UPI000B77500E|nr:annexin D3-like isoform X1 [Chenopodium quinoa]